MCAKRGLHRIVNVLAGLSKVVFYVFKISPKKTNMKYDAREIRGMSFRVLSVKFCEGFITKFGDEFSKSPNLVNNTSLNLVTNLWLTESGEKSITKFGDEFVDHRIL